MIQLDYRFNKFDSIKEPSDEQLEQLMENAAEKVRKSNQESDRKFFAQLRLASDEAKKRSVN